MTTNWKLGVTASVVALMLTLAATSVSAGGEADQAAEGSTAESGYTLPIVEPGQRHAELRRLGAPGRVR